MTTIPEQCANRPNLWRVACELAKASDPDKAFSVLAAVIKEARS